MHSIENSEPPCPDNAHGTPLTAPAGAASESAPEPGSAPEHGSSQPRSLRELAADAVAPRPAQPRTLNELAADAIAPRGGDFESLLALGRSVEKLLLTCDVCAMPEALTAGIAAGGTREQVCRALLGALGELEAQFTLTFGRVNR